MVLPVFQCLRERGITIVEFPSSTSKYFAEQGETMSKPNSGHFSGTRGANAASFARIIDSLPKNPDKLLERGWVETSHPDAVREGHRQFTDPVSGLSVNFDKGKLETTGHKGRDHYHVKNPNVTGKFDCYLDANGNPCAKGSEESHIHK